jgi:hypothetical protein
MRPILASILLLIPFLLRAQYYNEVSNAIGINHAYQDRMPMGGGCAFFDYDNDGDDDLYLSGGENRDYLYRNNGNGSFTEVGIAAGLLATTNYYTFGITTGDVDNDGDRDLFITTFMDEDSLGLDLFFNNKLFINNGNGTFTDNSISAGILDSSQTVAATFGDFNKDGFLDIYVANYLDQDGPVLDSLGTLVGVYALGFSNYYYINNGDGTFSQIANNMNIANTGCGLAVTATDYDNDNDVDIYIANDFGEWNTPNTLYQNNFPSNSFTDVSVASGSDIGLFGMGIAVGDYNEDLHLDYYVTNLGRNVLLHNNGNGTFTDTSTFAKVENQYVDTLLSTGWGCAFFDYNNDSYLDLFVANGEIPMPSNFRPTHPEDPNKLFHNNADGTFTDTTNYFNLNSLTIAHGMAYSDYDHDGDLDFVINVISKPIPSDSTPHSLFYRNDSIGFNNNWLEIKLVGTISNRDAFGAHLLVYAGGRTFLREVDGGSSHASQNSSVQHFGLAAINSIDSIVVIWPNTGSETFYSININQLQTLTEGQTTNLVSFIQSNNISLFPNPTKDMLHVHIEEKNSQPCDLNIYNSLGQLVYENQNIQSAMFSISLQALNLSNGIYWVKIGLNSMKKIRFVRN